MAVQRKVFRIEESARKRDTDGVIPFADNSERHSEFMRELQSLRALVAPAAPVDRLSMERARAQIVEAQAYKSELELIYAAIKRTREEAGPHASGVPLGERAERMVRELQAIVAGTEQATHAILRAAEEIGETVTGLADTLMSEHDRLLLHDIQDRVVHIFEACNFQDLTGQRIANVVAALKTIEDHIARLKSIWQGVEEFKPVSFEEPSDGERRYLNGPKLPGDAGHSTQDDIDGMFGCA